MTASHTLEPDNRAAAWFAAAPDEVDVPRLVVRAAGTLAAAAAAGAGTVIAVRRLAGAVVAAEPGLLLGATAAGIALVLAADAARRAGASLTAPVVARCGLTLAVAALALPPRAAGPADWLAIAGALVASAVTVMRLPTPTSGSRVSSRSAPAARPGPARRGPRPHAGRSGREPQPGLLRQRFERRELPAGAERVRGRVVVAVPAGAKAGYGHLGFCPAFVATPSVEVTTAYDGVEVTVAAAEVLPWGVRVECRLAEPAEEPLNIPVDIVALAPPTAA